VHTCARAPAAPALPTQPAPPPCRCAAGAPAAQRAQAVGSRKVGGPAARHRCGVGPRALLAPVRSSSAAAARVLLREATQGGRQAPAAGEGPWAMSLGRHVGRQGALTGAQWCCARLCKLGPRALLPLWRAWRRWPLRVPALPYLPLWRAWSRRWPLRLPTLSHLIYLPLWRTWSRRWPPRA